jgi:hypothetical protein
MQVSHAADHMTHAVIAPAETIEFGISTSAEFFQILSSTLYTNQKLAVVREVLCNAWDAHIAAGRTDKPIKITLTSNLLEIRDYGLGIPKESIGQIYGTYGNSTKKNDGLQTGGFGLGCKAPFAYTDHFEVESFCNGERTIYALSKSSAERMGKPGITPLVTLPTDETGLRVSIPVHNRDELAFRELIQEIVYNGEMLAELNSQTLPVLPFSKAESNWVIVRAAYHDPDIRIRYGNVIYPLPNHETYDKCSYTIRTFLNQLSRQGDYYKLIIQAPPHSISVTPSREALSLQDHTISTLTKLLSDFKDVFVTKLVPKMLSTLKEQIDQSVKDKMYGELFDRDARLPYTKSSPPNNTPPLVIRCVDDLAIARIHARYPNEMGFRIKDLSYRIDHALKLNLGKRGHLEQIKRKILALNNAKYDLFDASHWFARSIKGPLLAALQNAPEMNHKALYVNGLHSENARYPQISFKDFKPNSYSECLPLLRNVVALVHSRADLNTRLNKFPEMESIGSPWGIYVYAAPPSKTKLPVIREFFKKHGFTILDLTIEQPWDTKKTIKVVVPKKEKKVEGFAKLGEIYDSLKLLNPINCFRPDATRIVNPKCYIRVSYAKNDTFFKLMGAEDPVTNKIIKYYGNICAVVRNDRDEEKLIKQGIPMMDDYALEEIIREFTTNQKFLDYWEDSAEVALFKPADIYLSGSQLSTIRTLRIPEIRTAFGLKNVLSSMDYILIDIWFQVLKQHHYTVSRNHPGCPLKVVTDLHCAVKLSPTMKILQGSTSNNPIYEVIDLRAIRKLFNKATATPQDKLDRAANIIKIALLG